MMETTVTPTPSPKTFLPKLFNWLTHGLFYFAIFLCGYIFAKLQVLFQSLY